MKEKLKEVFGNIRSRVTSAFMHSASARGGEREVEELFVERKGSRPFVLSVFSQRANSCWQACCFWAARGLDWCLALPRLI